ncbi:hypothetical protein AF6_1545 [Anoxybacillus flavithermus TNO-09.006]|uniref:Uncharacterized protein n=1 Tax=Anoxybacillus flavithermus TaxID=33934 RepID=A0A178T9B6_9BACL|nr:hypothetical protein AF6_1545 [Anoxybacillus flavithermus TNO-09.006]OAO77552.1 hypothetical protein A0O32_2516 [Anoxybacillus flavithermus]OAO80973.1 hypothetical protein TAF16_0854 [Anoxybacillus flavithermus]
MEQFFLRKQKGKWIKKFVFLECLFGHALLSSFYASYLSYSCI